MENLIIRIRLLISGILKEMHELVGSDFELKGIFKKIVLPIKTLFQSRHVHSI